MMKIETSNQYLNLHARLSASVWSRLGGHLQRRLSFLENATGGSNPYKDPWQSPQSSVPRYKQNLFLSWKQKFDLRNPLTRLSWIWADWPLSRTPVLNQLQNGLSSPSHHQSLLAWCINLLHGIIESTEFWRKSAKDNSFQYWSTHNWILLISGNN